MIKYYASIKKPCVVVIEQELILLDWNNCELEDGILTIYERDKKYTFREDSITDVLKLVSENENKDLFKKYREKQLSGFKVLDGGDSQSIPTGQLHLVEDTDLREDF